jgi:CDGSH-type Zn-finger protein
MTEPHIAGRAPIGIDVEAGKEYVWCACGRSASQPFCDGAHRGSEFRPVRYTAEETGTLYFCCCKHTKGAPLCDGTHKTL